MPRYQLRRVADQKVFTAVRESTDLALFYFSVLTGDELSLDGRGPPPYLFGSRITPVGPVDARTPVYRKGG
jgi:hypothetical protein